MKIEKKPLLPMNIQFFAEDLVPTPEPELDLDLQPTPEPQETLVEQMARIMAENKRLKAATDKATAEAAEHRRKLQAKMTQAEKFETEKLEHEAAKENELQDLRRKVELNEKTATLMDLGYTKMQAQKAAEAQIDGDFETYTQIQKEVIEAKVKNATAKALKDMPIPPAGGKFGGVTKEQFESMGYAQRTKLFAEDPETYKKLNS